MSASAPLFPAWVYERDGRLVPFDPDKISLSLFDASEALGAADAFLARELTEGVVHFLGEESAGSIPSTTQIAETVAKVVRELGYPTLAQAFANRRRQPESKPPLATALRRPTPSARSATEPGAAGEDGFALSRDLGAARDAGLLEVYGRGASERLAGCVLDLAAADAATDAHPTGNRAALWLTHAIESAGHVAGTLIAVDGPEYHWNRPARGDEIAWFGEQLRLGLKATGLRAILNLNSATAPPWAADISAGPLFGDPEADSRRAAVASVADELRDHCLSHPELATPVVVDWHVGGEDLRGGDPRAGARLLRVARCLLERRNFAVTFDRQRRPHALGPGLSRTHSTLLLAVGLHLPRLLQLPGIAADPQLFMKKAAGLAAMAVSAAVQSRAHVHAQSRRPDSAVHAVQRRFLLARARLLVVPVGLAVVVRQFTGKGLWEDPAALSLAQDVLRSVNESLQEHGRRANLPVCIGDADGLGRATTPDLVARGVASDSEIVFGPTDGSTGDDPGVPPEAQLRIADALHRFGERITARVILPADGINTPEEVVDLLGLAWRQTGIERLSVSRLAARQLTLPEV